MFYDNAVVKVWLDLDTKNTSNDYFKCVKVINSFQSQGIVIVITTVNIPTVICWKWEVSRRLLQLCPLFSIYLSIQSSTQKKLN